MVPRITIFILLSFFISCDYYIVKDYKEHVGLISKSEESDNPDFNPCFKEKIFPYYYGRQTAEYAKGKDVLSNYFHEHYKNFGNTHESGFITFRFIINCKGEAGNYEIRQVGLDFKKKSFNRETVDYLFSLVKTLQDWNTVEFFGDKYDCFYHLTFKITNGELLEILP